MSVVIGLIAQKLAGKDTVAEYLIKKYGAVSYAGGHILNYPLRLLVPQGLTGWAQVHMSFPPRTHEEHKERLAYELYYIRNRSVLLDVAIILKTIKTIISREGA
jgi:dephospho-CoA kinase